MTDNKTPEPESTPTDTQDSAGCAPMPGWALEMEAAKQRFMEAATSLDRYGIPRDEIVSIIEILSDYIDDEAHGRGGYEKHFDELAAAVQTLRAAGLPNVKEHATLAAGAHVDHGVEVVATQEHENRAADRGCCVSSCSESSSS